MFVDGELTDAVVRGAILTAAAMFWVLVLARIVGLRSFSKMTAFDFVATFATGSLLASAAITTEWPAFIQAMMALLALFVVQVTLAWLRYRSDGFRQLIDNTPRILMRGREIDRDALRRTRVAHADVIAKLREHNVTGLDEVCVVVLEATGDISVITADDLEKALLDDTR